MNWRQVKRHTWQLDESGYEGEARMKETNHGFIISITVKNTDFDMELLNERDFFEKKQDALGFLKKHMEKDSY